MEGRTGPLALPSFVTTLLGKILAGDTDAAGRRGICLTQHSCLPMGRCGELSSIVLFDCVCMALVAGLVAPQAAGLFGPSGTTPPTAIRGRFYKYTFSNWSSLSANGTWWNRAKVKGDTAKVLTAAENAYKPSEGGGGGGRSWVGVPAVRRSPSARPWLLALGAVATAGVTPVWSGGLLLPRLVKMCWGLAVWWLALLADCERDRDSL